VVLVPQTQPAERKSSIIEPITALRHRALTTTGVAGLLYNWCFFTILGYAPFLMNLSPLRLGAVFGGWGALVAIFAIFGAPWFKARFGTPKTLYGSFALMAVISAVIGIWPGDKTAVIAATIASGVVIGMNNTLVTTAVMLIAPVPRPVAAATYGFVRFIGGGLAPYVAGKLVEHTSVHVPFLLGAGTVAVGALVLATVHGPLTAADAESHQPVSRERADAEAAVSQVPGIEDEAILAEEAIIEDRAYGHK